LAAIYRKLTIRVVRLRLALCHKACERLAVRFAHPANSFAKKRAIGCRWSEIVRRSHLLQHSLLVLERQEGQSRKQDFVNAA
jgi:hypothetical protein